MANFGKIFFRLLREEYACINAYVSDPAKLPLLTDPRNFQRKGPHLATVKTQFVEAVEEPGCIGRE